MTRKITMLLILLSLLLLIPVKVSAADEIKLISTDANIDFPGSLTFNITAQSQDIISRIRLRYEVDKMTYAPAFVEAWPLFAPATSVSTQWVWDMRKGSLPPGATVTYWWIIEDSSGSKLTTPKQSLSFDDSRYKWQKISQDKVTIYWYQGSSSFAGDLLKAAVEAIKRLGDDTGTYLEKPVSFYIYDNYQDLRGSMVATEEWTGGVSYYEFNIIAIGISPNNLDWGKRAVAHELGHLVTHQITFSPYGAVLPLWLDEGLAKHSEGPQSKNELEALTKAVSNGELSSLRSLSSPFPADAEGAFYAYAKSQSVVEYLMNSSGKDKINELLVTLKDGYTIDEALMKTYGFDLDGLDKAWTKYMMSQQPSQPDNGQSALREMLRITGEILQPAVKTAAAGISA